MLQNEKRCFLEKIMLLEYLLFTMFFMQTKKTSNGKEGFSKHKTIFSHHKFHSLVCHLLGKNRKWFLLLLALISQLCKLVIASLYNEGFIISKLHSLNASLVFTSPTRGESDIMKDGLGVVT